MSRLVHLVSFDPCSFSFPARQPAARGEIHGIMHSEIQRQLYWMHDDMTKPSRDQVPTLRLSSIDAFRGLVMFLMMAGVLEFGSVAKNLHAAGRDGGFWQLLLWQQSHVEWVGCVLHDMIQPSFSLLVGVVLPFSIAAR